MLRLPQWSTERALCWCSARGPAVAALPGLRDRGHARDHRLATTIEAWWPHILVFLRLGVTNARTEGFNRVIKNVKRVACGFRNLDNYQRRIMTHIAVTRAAWTTRMTRPTPPKCEEPP